MRYEFIRWSVKFIGDPAETYVGYLLGDDRVWANPDSCNLSYHMWLLP